MRGHRHGGHCPCHLVRPPLTPAAVSMAFGICPHSLFISGSGCRLHDSQRQCIPSLALRTVRVYFSSVFFKVHLSWLFRWRLWCKTIEVRPRRLAAGTRSLSLRPPLCWQAHMLCPSEACSGHTLLARSPGLSTTFPEPSVPPQAQTGHSSLWFKQARTLL